MRLSHVIISLPLLLSAAPVLTPTSAAFAAPMAPEDATSLLAKSHALNLKCNILGDADGQQLSDFVARAEISLAEKVSVSAARKAIATGRAEGKSASCDDNNRRSVVDVLAAAKTAVEAPVAAVSVEPNKVEATALAVVAPAPAKLAMAQPLEPQVQIIRPKKIAVLSKSKLPVKLAKTTKVKGNLDGYARVAESYYAALKCGSMSQGKMARLYQDVLLSHQQAVASNAARDVKDMLRNAETRANGRSCS